MRAAVILLEGLGELRLRLVVAHDLRPALVCRVGHREGARHGRVRRVRLIDDVYEDPELLVDRIRMQVALDLVLDCLPGQEWRPSCRPLTSATDCPYFCTSLS